MSCPRLYISCCGEILEEGLDIEKHRERILSLVHSANSAFFGNQNVYETQEKIEGQLDDALEKSLFMAIGYEEGPLGFLMATVHDKNSSLYRFYVDPELRRNGIGKELHSRFEEVLLEKGVEVINTGSRYHGEIAEILQWKFDYEPVKWGNFEIKLRKRIAGEETRKAPYEKKHYADSSGRFDRFVGGLVDGYFKWLHGKR